MESNEILISLSSLAITLAGFAAVFQAFHSGKNGDMHSDSRLNAIVEIGIAIALFSYSPEVIKYFEVSEITAYRSVSLFGGLYYIRWFSNLYSIRNLEHRTPKAYKVVCFNSAVIFIVFFAAALNLFSKSIGFFQLAILLMFLMQGLAFLAQFWSESADGP